MTRVLVLGAGGFLGEVVSRTLAATPGVDLRTHFQFEPARPDAARSPLVLDFDDVDDETLAAWVADAAPDAVVNCIGLIAGTDDQLRAVNVGLGARIVDAVAHRPATHLVHLGSAAEYGDQPRVPVPETADPAPRSVYAVSKLESTRHVLAAAEAGRLRATVLRVFNPVGAGSPLSTLPGRAGDVIDAALRGGPAVHMGDLSAWRDFVDTRDIAAAVVAAVQHPPARGALFNVGRGEAVCTRELVVRLAAVAGYDGPIEESSPDRLHRSAAVDWQCADITAITAALGWRPRHDLDAMLHHLWSSRGRHVVTAVDGGRAATSSAGATVQRA